MSTQVSGGAASARESARRGNGEFGTQVRGEVEMDLDIESPDAPEPEGPDYSSWEPVQVDTELARLDGERAVAMSRYGSDYDFVNREIARNKFSRGFRGTCTRDEMRETLAEMEAKAEAAVEAGERPDFADARILSKWREAQEHSARAKALAEQIEPFNDEFRARGGWNRAFLVPNAGGHVHKNMECSSCHPPRHDRSGNYRPGTSFHWVTDMSDHSETEIVEAAGERACTICYPSAPVSALSRPTSLFTPDEVQAAKDREKRAEEKKARDAAKIAKGLTKDGSELEVDSGRSYYVERFKTEQAAVTWAVGNIATSRAVGWGGNYALDEAKQAGIDKVKNAIVDKRLGYPDGGGTTAERDAVMAEVEAEVEKKVKAKAKRDGFQIT